MLANTVLLPAIERAVQDNPVILVWTAQLQLVFLTSDRVHFAPLQIERHRRGLGFTARLTTLGVARLRAVPRARWGRGRVTTALCACRVAVLRARAWTWRWGWEWLSWLWIERHLLVCLRRKIQGRTRGWGWGWGRWDERLTGLGAGEVCCCLGVERRPSVWREALLAPVTTATQRTAHRGALSWAGPWARAYGKGMKTGR